MKAHTNYYLVLTILLVLVSASPAAAQCGSPANCSIPSMITVCPTGDIPTMCIIRDTSNNPCQGSVITMAINANCLCGTPATLTAVTNNAGMVIFSPSLGGCCNTPGLVTYTDASGVVLGVSDAVNSPDMSGDCLVNLFDIALFSGAFFGTYSHCADFNMDGVLDLSDISILAQHLH